MIVIYLAKQAYFAYQQFYNCSPLLIQAFVIHIDLIMNYLENFAYALNYFHYFELSFQDSTN